MERKSTKIRSRWSPADAFHQCLEAAETAACDTAQGKFYRGGGSLTNIGLEDKTQKIRRAFKEGGSGGRKA
jgi:hypothetical protein